MDLARPTIDPAAFVAPTAQVFGEVSIGAGAVVMFAVVIRAELDVVMVGQETNVQDNVVIHVDTGFPCRIGRRVTIGHAAVVHGATVGEQALVGIRAVALNGSEIGEGAWLGAGAVLPPGKTVPSWTLAVGAPAKPVRELTEEEIRSASLGVDQYLEFGRTYGRWVDGSSNSLPNSTASK